MAQPVTVFRWDDPGAPQMLNGKISELFNVLQKCLVEGYGAKSSLGWTRSYYDPENFKSAWRNNSAAGGSGGSAYFYSNTLSDINSTIVRFSSCKSINSSGFIIGQGKISALSAQNATLKWVLIGTAIGFFFYSFHDSSSANKINSTASGRPSFYAGDIHSVIPNDAGRFIIMTDVSQNSDSTSVSASTTLGQMSVSPSTGSAIIKFYDADNANFVQGYAYQSMLGGNSGANGDTSTTAQIYPDLLTPCLFTYPGSTIYTAFDRLGVPIKNSSTRPAIRGVLPGLRCKTIPSHFGAELPVIINNGSDEYHMLPTAGNYGSIFIIQSNGEWHDPFF